MKLSKSFWKLKVWEKSHQLVLDVYKISTKFPKEEIYRLTSQLRRAVISVPVNIAEGFKRKSKAEKARFYNIAEASLEETRYFLILAKDLSYIEQNSFQQRIDEICKMLNSYISQLKK